MKQNPNALLKSHYQRLRQLSCEQLWLEEVPRFNALPQGQRSQDVSVIRALGVVFSESANETQKAEGRAWLRSLLQDPEEKVRRYAMLALPKMGSGETEERELLQLLQAKTTERETTVVAKTLGKFGAKATLALAQTTPLPPLQKAAQRLQANAARALAPSAVRLNKVFHPPHGLSIYLRCRCGLESFAKQEVLTNTPTQKRFRIEKTLPEWVIVTPASPFSLADIYQWRCFAQAGFLLGSVAAPASGPIPLEALAGIIASPLTLRLLETFTEGPVRYRLEFQFKGASRSDVKSLAQMAYERAPRLLNDSRNAPWEIQIFRSPSGYSAQLTPKLRPDPRFDYRTGDVPAASHPPLAACLAQLAGFQSNDRIWDPFCGSGLELVERIRLGGVTHVFGTDLSPEAVALTESHLAAISGHSPSRHIACSDFRDFRNIPELQGLSLILTNPPLGHRVPVPNLRELIEDLFRAAQSLLSTGGRLVLVNPFPKNPQLPLLQLQFRQKIDLGFTHGYLEKYVKLSRAPQQSAPKPLSLKKTPPAQKGESIRSRKGR
ncbi:MAG: hypothetical protein RLZZ399_2544 [Verrucomicrobiota bacterium]|jgi:hypothetical protein